MRPMSGLRLGSAAGSLARCAGRPGGCADRAGCGGGGEHHGRPTSSSPTSTAAGGGQSSSGSFNPAQIYKDVSPGVVTITSVFDAGSDSPARRRHPAGQGSGFVVDKDGDIVTNAHVVTSGGHLNGGGTPQKAKQVFVEFGDRNRVPAKSSASTPTPTCPHQGRPSGLDLQPVALVRRSSFAVGEPVAAIGSPFGEDQSLSVGVISATNRTVEGLTNFGDRQRDPDRRRRSTPATPAGRCSTPRAR